MSPEKEEIGYIQAPMGVPKDWNVAPKPKSATSRRVLPNRATLKPSVEQWRFLVSQHFPAGQIDSALLVISKESGGDPNAKSPGNYGLFQINWVHSAKVGGDLNSLFDPEVNARLARRVWGASGWKPFYAVCPRDGSNPYGIC